MEIFEVTTVINKKDKITLAVTQEKVINSKREYDRNSGSDREIIIANADGIRAIPLLDHNSINLIRVSATWAETDNSIPIIEGNPAAFEFRTNGGSWATCENLSIEGDSNFTGLEVRNPHTSGKKIKVRYLIGAAS